MSASSTDSVRRSAQLDFGETYYVLRVLLVTTEGHEFHVSLSLSTITYYSWPSYHGVIEVLFSTVSRDVELGRA